MTTETDSQSIPAANKSPKHPQFLGWGGESDGFTVLTVGMIRHDIEHGHYSGIDMWSNLAWIQPGPLDRFPTLVAVQVVPVSDRTVDDRDYIHQRFAVIETVSGRPLVKFDLALDGRA